jgi:hypothetical protein
VSLSLSGRSLLTRFLWECLFLALILFLTNSLALSQASPAAPPAPAPAPAVAAPAPAPVAPAPAVAAPHVDTVTVFQQTPLSTAQKGTPTFVLEISGTGLDTVNMANLRILVFPSSGVGDVTSLSRSSDNTKIFAQFTAPANYTLQEVALSVTGTSFVSFNLGTQACDFGKAVVVQPQIVSQSQSKTKYGNGVAANFHAIQISLVNECSVPVIVPLAGISITDFGQNTDASCSETGSGNMVPFSLDHVTSIYSANRKLTGARAIYFNSLQALATLGSAIQPFFAHGFAQGVAILGGGFTTASKEISIDMSTEQLQNITAQSFGATEQVSPGGSLQKFIFIRRNQNRKCKKSVQEQNIQSGNFSVNIQMIAASAQAPATTKAQATPSAPKVQ